MYIFVACTIYLGFVKIIYLDNFEINTLYIIAFGDVVCWSISFLRRIFQSPIIIGYFSDSIFEKYSTQKVLYSLVQVLAGP